MIVELALVLSLTIHLCHLLERIKHTLDDLFIGIIDTCPNFEGFGANELIFDLANIDGKIFDEVSHTFPLFARELGLFNAFDLVVLQSNVKHDIIYATT